MAQAETKTKIKPDETIKEPALYKIIYINDDKTPMDFVINTLMTYFHYTVEHSTSLTLDVHEQGSAVVAVLPYEIAEQKGIEITLEARAKDFPLEVKLEPDL